MVDKATRERIRQEADVIRKKKAEAAVPVAVAEPPIVQTAFMEAKKYLRPYHNISPKQRDKKMIKKGRLPDGATFYVVYNAEKQEWAGSLIITAPDKETNLFEATASGVFRLLSILDDKWREFLKINSKQGVSNGLHEGRD